ncbi:MAG: 16S rRNA (cytosine(1402)-N(4))-methyltransferase RsmH [Akkermansia sp.]|nr:16S rRNA (cytosine(1402)-N(4))-methyltransferase RsmH [Akkermansia sp.]
MSPNGPIYRAADAPPSGTCYRVLMWEEAALEPAAVAAWEQAKKDLLQRMCEAGIKGARGKLAAAEAELRELRTRAVEAPLATCAQAAFSYARVDALAQVLASEAGVLAFRLTPCAAEVLVELTGEEGLDTMTARWAAATPEVLWHLPALTEALAPAAAAEWQADCRAKQDETAAAEQAEEQADDEDFHHVTVLRQESVDALLPAEGKVFVDATLGGGGHTELLLQAGATVWGIDQDPAARAAARKRLAAYGDRLHILAGNFRNAAALLAEAGVAQVDGILADIGISSPQVDKAERGFSFHHEGPLDMRMNPAAPRSAADIVNSAPESELADILWQYGEERASRAIARRIVAEREKAPITTTTQLADIIAAVLPRKGRNHPATRSFQALRIAVNDELGALDALLESGLSLLKSGGRFAVITFHSLEDRAVKRAFDTVTRAEIDRPEWPAPRPNPAYAARLVFRKPLTASEAELAANPRARSAKLRVIEKL